MTGDFDGLVAVVTGGASGIGLATARLLSRRGARVAVLDLRPEGLQPDGPDVRPGADGPDVGPGADGPDVGPGADGPDVGPEADGPDVGPEADGPDVGPEADGPDVALGAGGPGVALGAGGPGVGAPLVPFTCDVTDDASVRAAVAGVVERLGRLDILVNNAGIGASGTIADNPDEEWRRVLDVNVVGIVRVTRAALPHLRRSPAAAIVNTCSIAATAGLPQRALYTASKGAVLSLTRAMAADHVREGIRVNCVNPGTVETPWVERLLAAAPDPAAERAALRGRQPHGRLVTAEEVAGAIAYLASPASGSTTGTDLAVDGGMDGLRTRPSP